MEGKIARVKSSNIDMARPIKDGKSAEATPDVTQNLRGYGHLDYMNHPLNFKIDVVSTALYPGRKHDFVKHAAKYFRLHPCRTLLEPFAGSAVTGFSLLYARIVESLILVEKDETVVCLLNGMLTDPNLAERFAAFECTRENVRQVLAQETGAFQYLVRSRVSNRAKWWGGLRTDIACRWCPDVVVPNLRRVYEMRDRITLIHGDGLEVMQAHAADESVGCFADPAYTADSTSKGHTIYRHHRIDHKRLFSILSNWRGPWLMTQDNCRLVRRLALCHRFQTRRVRMNNSDNVIMHELVIWRNRPMF
jgi:site-specific DNA-adenine methylase